MNYKVKIFFVDGNRVESVLTAAAWAELKELYAAALKQPHAEGVLRLNDEAVYGWRFIVGMDGCQVAE